MPYHQRPDANHYKIERQFLNSRFPLLRIEICKNPLTTKPFPRGFITGKSAINDDENIMRRLLNDIIPVFDTLLISDMYLKHK